MRYPYEIRGPDHLRDKAAHEPDSIVRILFRNANGQTGILETTAAHAYNPNRSDRFFPPSNESAATLGWPVPYWYKSEIFALYSLREGNVSQETSKKVTA
jgi:hypothetical protein